MKCLKLLYFPLFWSPKSSAVSTRFVAARLFDAFHACKVLLKLTRTLLSLSKFNSSIAEFRLAKSIFLAKSDVSTLGTFSLQILFHN